jgi:hypothetical protein
MFLCTLNKRGFLSRRNKSAFFPFKAESEKNCCEIRGSGIEILSYDGRSMFEEKG